MKTVIGSELTPAERAEIVRECVENFNLYLNRWPEPRALEGAVVEW